LNEEGYLRDGRNEGTLTNADGRVLVTAAAVQAEATEAAPLSGKPTSSGLDDKHRL
jgi:hypothetical protein